MESLLANFDIDNIKNFWKLYPSWKTPKVIYEFYTKDKSKDKSESSLLMWAMLHMFDKSESNSYRSLDSEERIEVINDDVLNNSGFKWDKLKPLVDEVEKLLLNEEERTYYALVKYMEERRKFIEDEQKDLSFDKIKSLDEAIKRNGEIMKELDRLKAAVELTSDGGNVKGGRLESATERGLI